MIKCAKEVIAIYGTGAFYKGDYCDQQNNDDPDGEVGMYLTYPPVAHGTHPPLHSCVDYDNNCPNCTVQFSLLRTSQVELTTVRQIDDEGLSAFGTPKLTLLTATESPVFTIKDLFVTFKKRDKHTGAESDALARIAQLTYKRDNRTPVTCLIGYEVDPTAGGPSAQVSTRRKLTVGWTHLLELKHGQETADVIVVTVGRPGP